MYDGSCALGPGLALTEPDELSDLPIELQVLRAGSRLFKVGSLVLENGVVSFEPHLRRPHLKTIPQIETTEVPFSSAGQRS